MFRILRPGVGGPLVLNVDDVLEPGVDQLLLVIFRRGHRGAELVACRDEVTGPLREGGVGRESAVVAGERAGVGQLDIAARVEVPMLCQGAEYIPGRSGGGCCRGGGWILLTRRLVR